MGVSIVAAPEGGMLKAKFRDLTSTPQTVKASQGNLYGLQVHNQQVPAADAWIQVFDKATPSPGTDTPDKEFRVKAGESAYFTFQPQGVGFLTAITVASTTAEKGGQSSARGVQLFVDYV